MSTTETAAQTTHGGRPTSRLAAIFVLKPDALNWACTLFILAASLVLVIIFIALGKEQYLLSERVLRV